MMHLAQPAAQQGSWMSSVLMLVVMLAIFYFLLIRPQQKRQKQHQAMIAALKKAIAWLRLAACTAPLSI
jgi:preprotein translocase, YajC subunit